MEGLHETLILVADGIILFFEFIGVVVMLWTGLNGIVNYVRRNRLGHLHMFQGMATALGFLLIGEILHTITVREFKDLIMVGGLILLRVAITMLINWEINLEKKENAINDNEEPVE
ncbi:MAG TPA: DUF1622 domain-containing protein [Clostridiales bacterium]|nr:DUF1622 domain-containing protein [Clostridiales bacterium]